MDFMDYSTVENMVKYKNHDVYEIPCNPHSWFWLNIDNIWHPVRKK